MLRPLSTRALLAIAIIVGVAHGALAIALSAIARGRPIFAFFPPQDLVGTLLISVSFLGLVALGGAPVVLYYRYRLIAPLITLLGLFIVTFVLTFKYFEEARTQGLDASLVLFLDSVYTMFAGGLLVLVLLVAAGEYVLRDRLMLAN